MDTVRMNRMNTDISQAKLPEKIGQRKWMLVAAVAALVVVGAMALGAAYIWFSGGSGQPSTPLNAPVLTQQPGDDRTLFELSPQSEVRFSIQETLLGNPKTVIGTTNQVAGELLVDFENPANTELGTIRINVRTLETDNEIRTRALRGQILQAERAEFEFAEFVPTALIDLPDTVTLGEPFDFQIQGNLTVHGVTREMTFDATLTPLEDDQLEGSASTTVIYKDFGMNIPEAPGVANVSDEVRLEIDFTAQAVAS